MMSNSWTFYLCFYVEKLKVNQNKWKQFFLYEKDFVSTCMMKEKKGLIASIWDLSFVTFFNIPKKMCQHPKKAMKKIKSRKSQLKTFVQIIALSNGDIKNIFIFLLLSIHDLSMLIHSPWHKVLTIAAAFSQH